MVLYKTVLNAKQITFHYTVYTIRRFINVIINKEITVKKFEIGEVYIDNKSGMASRSIRRAYKVKTVLCAQNHNARQTNTIYSNSIHASVVQKRSIFFFL